MGLESWVGLAQDKGKGRGLAVDRAWGMPASKGQARKWSRHVVLVSTFTVSCGEVWSCSSVAALLALSPTHGHFHQNRKTKQAPLNDLWEGLYFGDVILQFVL